MFKSHFARPPAKCVTAFHEVRLCTPCKTNLARQGKRGWAVRFHGLLHPTQALEHTHRAVRPALQVPSCQESLHVPGFKVRADCSYPPMQCARHNTGCGVACSMPPRIRTGVPELNWGCFRNNRGCLAYDAIAFRARTMRHVYLSPRVKKGWKRRENREFCRRKNKIGGRQFLHTCKSGVARESFSVRQFSSHS